MASGNKLERDVEWCRSELLKLPVYNRNRSLCNRIVESILPLWAQDYGEESTTWSKIRKKFAKEFNETEPAISFILKQVDGGGANMDETRPIVLVDICSGFGIASMLLSELLDASRVKCIWLLDKRWPSNPHSSSNKPNYISTAHLHSRTWPIPIQTRQVDMKRSRDKHQLPTYVYGNDTQAIFFGIHLCKKLAVHAINLFHDSDNAICLVLKPCCLPGTRANQLYIRDEIHGRQPMVYEFRNGYSFRLIDLMKRTSRNEDDETDDVEVSTGESEKSATISSVQGGAIYCCSHSGACTDNARFSSWVDHLESGCTSKTCRVRRETIEIQRHHFQNEFLFCERIKL